MADTSLEFDRTDKRIVYAQAGIADYWVVNLIDNVVEIYRQPQADGASLDKRIATSTESISPLAFPELTLDVREILGL